MTCSVSAAYQDYLAGSQRRSALAEQAMPLNKAALFDALEPAGIALIVVAFDGAGDSGQIKSVTAFDAAKAEIALPNVSVTLRVINAGASGLDAAAIPLAGAIEMLCYDVLEATHGGWETEDGAFGEFCFDAGSRTITLENNERRTETDFSSHVF